MLNQLVECVPNFSEGQNPEIIKRITDSIESVDGAKLLDVDPGFEMNRTVVTFIGSPEAVKEAAFRAIKTASELIDMQKHKGSHPRMGATDVCPFVPVNNISVEECTKLAEEVAERVGNELKIPVYLYEKSARIPERTNLAVVRAGEYEALEEKLKDPKWTPDYGPANFNASAGATVMGVREFLIAYNINLNTKEPKYAIDIAYELREKGRSARKGNTSPFYFKGTEILKYRENYYPCGSCDFIGSTIEETIAHCKEEHQYDLADLLKENGIRLNNLINKSVKKPGKFTHCKAIGWLVPEYGRAQISINLTDYNITSMQHVFDETMRLAAERGIVVTGSEIVGMVPFKALFEAGKHYLQKQGSSAGIPYKDVLEAAVQSLGLNDVSEFKISDRVLGLPESKREDLVELKLIGFIDEVSRETPAPGGGSIAAVCGALGAALSSMVSNLTANKRGSEQVDKVLNECALKCQIIKDKLIKLIDEDTNAFNDFMAARRLPSKTDEEKKLKEAAMMNGIKKAVTVPLQTAEQSLRAIEVAKEVIEFGNPNSITDVGVGAHCAYTGVKGGVYNILINLKDISDDNFNLQMREKCTALEKKAKEILEEITLKVEKSLSS
jgi:glutamate formiminotransferase/formiminotetrahydrofolate cyclodeaminase